MLMNKSDAAIEKLMNEQGLSHGEAIAQARGKKKAKAPAEGSAAEEASESPEEEAAEDSAGAGDAQDMETVDLPAALCPGASIGKEVDISVTGIVKSKSNGMVSVELSRTSGSSRTPMKTDNPSVEYPR
jgi:hypothetical protein